MQLNAASAFSSSGVGGPARENVKITIVQQWNPVWSVCRMDQIKDMAVMKMGERGKTSAST